MNIRCPRCRFKIDVASPVDGGSVECVCPRCGNKFLYDFPKPEPEVAIEQEQPVETPSEPQPVVNQPEPVQPAQPTQPVNEPQVVYNDGYTYVYDQPKRSSKTPLWIALGVIAAGLIVAGIIFLPGLLSGALGGGDETGFAVDTTGVDEGSIDTAMVVDSEQAVKNEVQRMWGNDQYLSSEFRNLIKEDEKLCAQTGDIYCIDYDLWTQSQENVLSQEVAQVIDITQSSATAYVRLKHLDNRFTTTKLQLIKENGQWRVDEIIHGDYYEKRELAKCLKEVKRSAQAATAATTATTTMVCVDGVNVRLRTSPEISDYNIIKSRYGYNLHPNKGDLLEYLGEAGDFYYVNYKGTYAYISKQHTYLVYR